MNGGRVIATAPNIFKNSPTLFQRMYSDPIEQKNSIRQHCSVHAEARVVKMAGEASRGGVVYVARVNEKGAPMMSKPCNDCHNTLFDAGVKAVVYTEGFFVETIAA